MQMFESLLNSIPKNRSDMVTELEIPEVTLEPYIWTDLDDSLTTRSDSLLTASTEDYQESMATLDTDSSIPLSRAITDSEIDYAMFRRYKNRSVTDPWIQMRMAMDKFPPGYLDSLSSFQESADIIQEEDIPRERVHHYDEELRLKMERFFDEECRVFTPDDPGLDVLQDALRYVDMKLLEADMDSITTILLQR